METEKYMVFREGFPKYLHINNLGILLILLNLDCQGCIGYVQKRKCTVCGRAGDVLRYQILDQNLPPDAKNVFSSLQQKCCTMYKTLEFQTKQSKMLVDGFKKKMSEVAEQMKAIHLQKVQIEKQIEEARLRTVNIQNENAKLREVIAKYQAQEKRGGSPHTYRRTPPVVTRKPSSQLEFFQNSHEKSLNASVRRIMSPETPYPLKEGNAAFMKIGHFEFKSPPQSRTNLF